MERILDLNRQTLVEGLWSAVVLEWDLIYGGLECSPTIGVYLIVSPPNGSNLKYESFNVYSTPGLTQFAPSDMDSSSSDPYCTPKESSINSKIDYLFNQKDPVLERSLDTAIEIASTFQTTPQTIDTSAWKTYTNTKYGFSFMYPSGYAYDFNASEFSKLPKTIQDACNQAKAAGGQGYDANGNPIPPDCGLRYTSQQEMLSFAQQLSNAHIGDSIMLPNDVYSSRHSPKVIALGNQKGVLDFSNDFQAVGTHVTFYWLDSAYNLLSINRELTEDTLVKATTAEDYNNFLQIISTFKLTK